LQRDLLRGFSSEDFQEKLRELQATHPKGSRQFNTERQRLFLTVQGAVLPEHGFEGSQRGVWQMMQALGAFNGHAEFDALGLQLNLALGLLEVPGEAQGAELTEVADEGAAQEPGEAGQADQAQEIEVTVRLAVKEEEAVQVLVSSAATMRDVKEAVANKLGRPEIIKDGRLVRRAGGALTSFTDTQRLGSRHSVLLIGVNDLQAAKVAPEEASVRPAFTRERALSLQTDLQAGFAEEQFQTALKELESKYTRGSWQFTAERQKLFLTVQSVVLPKYGFEGSPKGVLDMMNAFTAFTDEEFQRNGLVLNHLLRLDLPTQPPDAAIAEAESTAKRGEDATPEVEVKVKHALRADGEVHVMVPGTANMGDVKAAVAGKLGRPDIMAKGRLVRRAGDAGAFTSFTDAEKLGSRRSLLLMGVDSLEPAPDAPAGSAAQIDPDAKQAGGHPSLTLEQALSLQRDLLRGFSSEDFQEKLRELQATHPKGSRQFNTERQRLFLTVQGAVLPEHGFEGSQRGVWQMMQALGAFNGHAEFDALGLQLNLALGLVDRAGAAPGADPRSADAAAAAAEAARGEAPSAAPSLTREQALSLQRDLHEAFAEEGFQSKLSELEESHPKGSRQFRVERQKLLLTVQSAVLPRHGFEGSQEGVMEMMRQFAGLEGDEEFQRTSLALNRLLRLVDASEPAAGPEAPPVGTEAEAAEVEVTVRHAVSEEAVCVSVPGTATMREVREMLATKLARAEVTKRGRLVRRAGSTGAFTSLADSEKLGSRRNLLLMGMDDLKAATGTLPPITREQALRLQRDLERGFGDPEFQDRLMKLEHEHGTDTSKFMVERQRLALTVQGPVLAKYGFEGNAQGVPDMMDAFKAFNDDEQFQQNGLRLSQLLRLSPLADSPSAEATARHTGQEGQVGTS